MTVKLLTELHLQLLSLNGGYTVSSESILVKMSHCWKVHVTAQIIVSLDECATITLFLTVRIVTD